MPLIRITTEELPGRQRILQRQLIAFGTQTADYTLRQIGKIRFSPERFARKNIGKVNLNEGQLYSGKRITQGDTGMGIGSRIDDNEIHTVTNRPLNPIYQFSLGITLEIR